jgi:hypothetical protein
VGATFFQPVLISLPSEDQPIFDVLYDWRAAAMDHFKGPGLTSLVGRDWKVIVKESHQMLEADKRAGKCTSINQYLNRPTF